MDKSSRVNTKTPKKRAAVTGDLIGVRVPPDMAKQLDDWRRKQDDLPGRPEAIRRLIEAGLASTQGVKPVGKRATAESDAMAGNEIDRVHNNAATPEQRAIRKRRLLKGQKEFR